MKHGRSYGERMQRLVADYREEGGAWPASARDIAKWMIRTNRWDKGESTLIEICARDVARAMREEYHTDPQGRRVRTKHAAKFPAPGAEDGQLTIWDDIRTAPREFMERAFMGRRNQVVGDCIQLNTDVKSYNENKCKDNPIQLLLDFTDDVAEAEQSGHLRREANDDSDIDLADPDAIVHHVVGFPDGSFIN